MSESFSVVDEDEDRTKVAWKERGKEVGHVTFVDIMDPYEYDFEGVIGEDECYDLLGDHATKIEHIAVDETRLGDGIGGKLMKEGLRVMEERGNKRFYLNASPMGMKGLSLTPLIRFYEKFGFRVVGERQGNNAMMVREYVK